jgi:hypothetical protein
MVAIPWTNIGCGGGGSFLSCLVLSSILHAAELQIYHWLLNELGGYLFLVACSFSLLALLWFWDLFFSYLLRRLLARITDRHCHSFQCFLPFLRSLLLGFLLCLLLLLGMCGLYSWVLAAYVLLDVVSAVPLKLVWCLVYM